ncbi:MAG TPA: hypothetical protein VNH83_13660 [Bryobacteraceae bacterium]|jgi:cytochrome bd-type quinol oxidase subunit 1|nr:hypothetical protein [Bryobacteraceae bacterium]
MGVVTGIPMELQFGTNCAMFANGSYGLLIGLAWWIPSTALATGYFVFV